MITPAGVRIYVDLRDERAQRLIASRGDFNPTTLAIWHWVLGQEPWTHVIDVGANYGEMLANDGLPRGARIIAVEPNAQVLPFLRKTLAGLDGVQLLDVALSDREGEAEFLVDPTWSGKSRIVEHGSGSGVVPTTTLSRILLAERVPLRDMRLLVKIDVEGHEANVLQGMSEVLPRLGKFAALIEISHLSEADRRWIIERFDAYALTIQTWQMQRTDRLDADGLRSSSLYHQDAVIVRKPP